MSEINNNFISLSGIPFQIVEFHEIEEHLTEMEYNFYLIIVKKASADENEEFLPQGGMSGGVVPKFYLKPVTVMPLDTFAATHGPYTEVDGQLVNLIS